MNVSGMLTFAQDTGVTEQVAKKFAGNLLFRSLITVLYVMCTAQTTIASYDIYIHMHICIYIYMHTYIIRVVHINGYYVSRQ